MYVRPSKSHAMSISRFFMLFFGLSIVKNVIFLTNLLTKSPKYVII